MMNRIFTHPVASTARAVENFYIKKENSKNVVKKLGYGLLARGTGVILFPFSLFLELFIKRIPKTIQSVSFSKDLQKQIKWRKNIEKIQRYLIGIAVFPLGLVHSPDCVTSLFLKTFVEKPEVRPFGTEEIYGSKVHQMCFPRTIQELQSIVKEASRNKKQISLVGAGMSQGTQAVPLDPSQIVIDLFHFKEITFGKDGKTVKVQAGAVWEEVQMQANQRGKSVIVKQASDVFSIGGSIGINCHGWAHEHGAISSTVESLEVIDANGDLKILSPQDEMFGCFFGTLGYFGIVVSATLKIVENEHLVESTEEIELEDFAAYYETKVKGQNVPLFGGRLVLDSLKGAPLRKVCMVSYKKDKEIKTKGPVITDFQKEAERGTRIQRVGLQAVNHLSDFSVRRLISHFWEEERADMLKGKKITRNEALHPPINAFMMLHDSYLHAQWLQEYFIKKENLPCFLRYLGRKLQDEKVRLINATIRPTPKDTVSVLPYAEEDRYAVVISFAQFKTKKGIKKTKKWMEEVNKYVISAGDVYYQAYMPYASRDQFEQAYGIERVEKMRALKEKYDPQHLFGNRHTQKYFDKIF